MRPHPATTRRPLVDASPRRLVLEKVRSLTTEPRLELLLGDSSPPKDGENLRRLRQVRVGKMQTLKYSNETIAGVGECVTHKLAS